MLQGMYTNGILVGLGDGSVRLVNTSISQVTWINAVQPAGEAQLFRAATGTSMP